MPVQLLNGADLNGQPARNAADPTADQDLATKKYVDNKAGGSAAAGLALSLQPLPLVGEWIGDRHNGTSDLALDTDGTVFFIAFVLPTGTYDAARINIRTAAGAGSLVRAGFYADDGGKPGAFLTQTAAVAATATGVNVLTLGTPIVASTAGRLIWGGVVQQGGASTRAQLRRITSAYWPNQVYSSSTDETQPYTAGLRASGVTGDFPTTISTVRNDNLSGGITIHFRRSA